VRFDFILLSIHMSIYTMLTKMCLLILSEVFTYKRSTIFLVLFFFDVTPLTLTKYVHLWEGGCYLVIFHVAKFSNIERGRVIVYDKSAPF
jgi:hypothetical protein